MNFIQRYQPALSWVNELDKFFDRNGFNQSVVSAPRESFHESESAWVLRLDLPGFSKSDIALTVNERVLNLKAETSEDRPLAGKSEHRWKLGSDVDETGITARLENGVLELTLPKRVKPQAEPIKIEIL
jgi:HSP20 family protein